MKKAEVDVRREIVRVLPNGTRLVRIVASPKTTSDLRSVLNLSTKPDQAHRALERTKSVYV